MARRFQFGLGRLLVAISAICVAAAALKHGFDQMLQLKSAWPFFVGLMLGYVMICVAICCLGRPFARK